MNSIFKKDYGSTSFITGIRAFAAMAVVLIHAGGAGLRNLGSFGNNIVNFGQAGVYVFFVISGFSVALSYNTSNGYFDYISKRLWRIAPLYYFWLSIFTITGFSFNLSTLYNYLMHIFFLSSFDYRIANSIISVEWSISVEVFWYFFVPLLLKLFDTNKKTMILIIVSFAIYYFSKKISVIILPHDDNAAYALHWSPIPYAISYSLGIFSYRLRPKVIQSGKSGNTAFLCLCALLLIRFSFPSVIKTIFQNDLIFTSILTAAIILFGSEKSFLIRIFFSNRITQFIGIISYGIYLSHVLMLGIFSSIENLTFRFIAVTTAAILISTITYYFIEQKFIMFGKKIALK